jgi:hypothetical protein
VHVLPLELGSREEELGEEVAPAELSEQLLVAAASDLGRGDRAEVELLGQTTGNRKRLARDRRASNPSL